MAAEGLKTTARESARKGKELGQDGQSILEFLFMLPVMIGLVVLMVRVNSAIQVSIVNQKYSRMQALRMSYNSPWYPRLDTITRPGTEGNFVNSGYNRMVIGVSDEPISAQNTKAKATEQAVIRSRVTAGMEGASGQEPIDRAVVRVRTTVALCTPTITIKPGILAESKNIGEETVFDFCRGQDEGG